MTAEERVDRLVSEQRLERVAPDPETAAVEIGDAEAHLKSAERLLPDDPIMAYTALYDGLRKAVSAHMRANGIRVGPGAAHHLRTFEYAEAALSEHQLGDAVDRLDDMRVMRNDAEYRVRRIGDEDVRSDLATGHLILAAIKADLGM